MVKLVELDTLPAGFLELSSPTQLFEIMPQPTLLHLKGRRTDTLFITVLLHGNEDTSFYALQQILRKYQHQPLPRSLTVFFGNTEAARFGLRRLPEQPDYNRVWPGTDLPACAETQLMQTIVDKVAALELFASVDIHNNSGTNPFYGCINVLDERFLYLAQLFSRTVVFFETPRGVQSMAMAKHCPAVTLECGKAGVAAHTAYAVNFIEAVLHLDHFPQQAVRAQDIDLVQTVARVTIPEKVSFSFTHPAADIQLAPELEHYNFTELPTDTTIARTRVDAAENVRLEAWDDEGQEVGNLYFEHRDQCIQLAQTIMPAMLTLDETVIRQDCLCYLMKRLPLP